MIYIAKSCDSLEEFKIQKFRHLLCWSDRKDFENLRVTNLENGYHVADVHHFVRQDENSNPRKPIVRESILVNLDDGGQMQLDYYEEKLEHIELFNANKNLVFEYKLPCLFDCREDEELIAFKDLGVEILFKFGEPIEKRVRELSDYESYRELVNENNFMKDSIDGVPFYMK